MQLLQKRMTLQRNKQIGEGVTKITPPPCIAGLLENSPGVDFMFSFWLLMVFKGLCMVTQILTVNHVSPYICYTGYIESFKHHQKPLESISIVHNSSIKEVII